MATSRPSGDLLKADHIWLSPQHRADLPACGILDAAIHIPAESFTGPTLSPAGLRVIDLDSLMIEHVGRIALVPESVSRQRFPPSRGVQPLLHHAARNGWP